MILQMEGSCDEIAQMIAVLHKVNEPKIQARERAVKTEERKPEEKVTETILEDTEKEKPEWEDATEPMTIEQLREKSIRKTPTKKERREKHSRSRVIDIFKRDSHGTFIKDVTVETVTAVAKHVGAKHPANVSSAVDSGNPYHGIWKFITRVDRGEYPVLQDEEDED